MLTMVKCSQENRPKFNFIHKTVQTKRHRSQEKHGRTLSYWKVFQVLTESCAVINKLCSQSENLSCFVLASAPTLPVFAHLATATPLAPEDALVVSIKIQLLQPGIFRVVYKKVWHGWIVSPNVKWPVHCQRSGFSAESADKRSHEDVLHRVTLTLPTNLAFWLVGMKKQLKIYSFWQRK